MKDKMQEEAEQSNSLERLTDEMRPFFGHVCLLYRSEIGVLCGVGQDEMDLYYIVRTMSPAKDVWYSAVGHCESLKPYLPEEMYEQMLNLFDLNGGLPTEFSMMIDEGEGVRSPYSPGLLDRMMKKWRADLEAHIAANSAEG